MGLNYKDLILSAEQIEAAEEAKKAAAEKVKEQGSKKKGPVFTALQSADEKLDIVIERATASTLKRLVIMVSPKQPIAYIEDTKSGDITLLAKNEPDEGLEELCKFFNGVGTSDFLNNYEEIPMLRCGWLRSLPPRKDYYRSFLSGCLHQIFSREEVHATVKAGLIHFEASDYYKEVSIRGNVEEEYELLTKYAPLVKSMKGLEAELRADGNLSAAGNVEESLWVLKSLNDRFGVDNTRNIMRMWFERFDDAIHRNLLRVLNMPAHRGGLRRTRSYDGYHIEVAGGATEKVIFNTAKLFDYIGGQPQREGFADDEIGVFLNIWADDLQNQVFVYDCVVDKYPTGIDTHHRKTSNEARTVSPEQLEEYEWQAVLERTQPFEWSSKTHVIVAPHSGNDMLDEARMQSNCLAGYVPTVASGDCDIFFLRYATTPDKSLVTIEVRDKKVVQVKAACNAEADDAELEQLGLWAKEKNLTFSDSYAKKVDQALEARAARIEGQQEQLFAMSADMGAAAT